MQDSFLGTVRRNYVLQIEGYSDQDQNFLDYPMIDGEYDEWIDLLESVLTACDVYTFMELGAGFGRWSVRAGAAAAQRGGLSVNLVAVEPEHTHFLWMQDHFSLNGFRPDDHELVEAAVNDVGDAVWLTVEGESQQSKPEHWYGQTVVSSRTAIMRKVRGIHPRMAPARNVKRVNAVSLNAVLSRCDRVDLADLDIQGLELVTLAATIDRVNAQIRRLHIGTHSADIEVGLRLLMSTNGWESVADWPGGRMNETPFGNIEFGDGVQTWLNPRLA